MSPPTSGESLDTVFKKLTTAAEQRHEANKLTAEARTSIRNILDEAFEPEVTITGVDATESTRVFVEVEADMDQFDPDGLPSTVEVSARSPNELVLTNTEGQLENPDDLKALIRHMSSEEQVIPIPTIIDQARSLGTDREQAWAWIQRLYRRGEAYEPNTGYLRLVK